MSRVCGPAGRLTTGHPRSVRRAACGLLAGGLLLAVAAPGQALAQEGTPPASAGAPGAPPEGPTVEPGGPAPGNPRSFPATGYTVTDDAIWSFFSRSGGASTFGEPISRAFTLFGQTVQLFRYAALQVLANGSGQALPLAGEGLLPYTSFDGLTVPAPDAALAFVTPTPDQPNYPARLQVFLQAAVREPFWSAYDASGGAAVWGLPTSAPAADPYNPAFVYQRFQNGILFSNAVSGTTQPLPLGAYLRAVLTGEDLPADLASAAKDSPLLHQYAAERANGLARPDVLPQTDLTDAFVPDAG